ncbi:MAG TPA: hypothetical protein VFF68_14575 [Anaerolineaceae bacterium]|nr:hypothetical protein [Anaerolineaceae bacterium]
MTKIPFRLAICLSGLFFASFLFIHAPGWLAQPDQKTLAPGVAAPPLQQPTPGGYSLYLPSIIDGDGQTEEIAPPEGVTCGLSPQEQELADRFINDTGQQRASLTCDPILAQVARAKAEDLGQRNYFDHVNPDGFGPNYMVQQAGYLLPDWYFQEASANNIESLAGGFGNAQLAWDALLESESHRIHVLGENDFFVEQLDYGIGYAYVEDSQYHYYWVILTARH